MKRQFRCLRCLNSEKIGTDGSTFGVAAPVLRRCHHRCPSLGAHSHQCYTERVRAANCEQKDLAVLEKLPEADSSAFVVLPVLPHLHMNRFCHKRISSLLGSRTLKATKTMQHDENSGTHGSLMHRGVPGNPNSGSQTSAPECFNAKIHPRWHTAPGSAIPDS